MRAKLLPILLSALTLSLPSLLQCHLISTQNNEHGQQFPSPTSTQSTGSNKQHHYDHTIGQLSNGHQQERASPLPPENFKRVCYFRMDPKTELKVSQVDGNLCTHLILAFARINGQGDLVVARATDYDYLAQVKPLKRAFPHLKVMISVFNEEEFNGFPRLTLAPAPHGEAPQLGAASGAPSANELRLRFAKSAMEFLQRFHLDGIDLDWEFPNFPATILSLREHERSGLSKILTSLRSAIVENFYARQTAEQQQQAAALGRGAGARHYGSSSSLVEPYLLTVAIAGQEAVLRASYELKQLANLCDWLNVMSYDYFLFKPYAPFTGPNAPLFPIVDPFVPILSKLSMSWTANKLLVEEQLPRDKIVMGIPTYARAYRLIFRQSQPTPFTLALGARGGGQIEDYLSYGEVLELLSRKDTVAEFDERAQVPYLLTDSGYTWVSYEDARSVKAKVRFILSRQLGGYMTWNLNSDSFNPLEADSKQRPGAEADFPLHRAMLHEALANLKPSR